ncbi:MAG: glycosyltransferase family 4 protein [Butyrivibrio sp.]|nr:glycosyltransferase family 4 protein [Butyrivibrio sp.]
MTENICVYIDITSLMDTAFLSGIQRVVIEISRRLIDFSGINCKLVYYKGKKEIYILNNDEFRKYLDGSIDKKIIRRKAKRVYEDLYEAGAIWLDLDAVWNNVPSRAELYPILKSRDVTIVTLIHDILPITDPRFFPSNGDWAFAGYVGAAINYADIILTTTDATKDEVKKLIYDIHGRRDMQLEVVGLGADYDDNVSKNGDIASICSKYVSTVSKYVLMVGTIEPRKNHAVVLRAFEKKLFGLGIGLVFAGRKGWNSDSFISHIEEMSKSERLFAFFEGMNDASIDYLYKNCSVLAFPSFAEGYGLPIVEALQRDVPVVAANINVSREVGGEYCRYADVQNEDEWIDAINYCLNNNDSLKKKISEYQPTSWDEVVDIIVGIFRKDE